MRKIIFAVLLFSMLFCNSCITLFSEIHQESHQNHHVANNCEDLEHRIAELEERVHFLMELLEEHEDDEEREDDED